MELPHLVTATIEINGKNIFILSGTEVVIYKV